MEAPRGLHIFGWHVDWTFHKHPFLDFKDSFLQCWCGMINDDKWSPPSRLETSWNHEPRWSCVARILVKLPWCRNWSSGKPPCKGSWTTWRCATWLKIVGVHRALGNLNLCSRLSPDRIILSIWCLDRSKNFWETWRWTLMSWYPRRQPSKRLSQMGGAFCKLWPLAVWTIRFLPFYIPQFGMKFPNSKRAMYTYRNVQNIYQHLSQTWPTCGDHSPVHDMEHTEMHYHSPHVSPQIWIPASNEVHLVQHPEEFRRLPPMRAASGISCLLGRRSPFQSERQVWFSADNCRSAWLCSLVLSSIFLVF